MLLESERHSARDLEEWRRLERYDAALSHAPELHRFTEKAHAEIERFHASGPCVAFVSWGKDSTVVAHLAVQHGIPLVWSRIEPFANPDSLNVRDAFLTQHPTAEYIEARIDCPGTEAGHGDECECLVENLRRAIGSDYFSTRHLSGVRAEESGLRRMRMIWYGETSKHACAPIGWWRAHHVFAYLHKHNLPVHPAYAMSMGGTFDRRKLRVDDLGGDRGTSMGRRQWEWHYYPEKMHELGYSRP